jgi:integrase
VFKAALVATSLPDLRLYDLRHTAATIALVAGIPLKVVSERLGHASIKITADTYQHVIPSLQREAADRLDAVFGGH